MKDAGLTFHIIFTPGTVHSLRLFTLSLLKWSGCFFRLVSNGCRGAERRELERLCRRRERLEFLPLPGRRCLPHAEALNRLQEREQGPYFAFLDSDLLASGPFLAPVLAALPARDAVFSGTPFWLAAGQETADLREGKRDRFRGWLRQTSTGWQAGSSSFAIYHQPYLRHFRQHHAIGFERCQWRHLSFRCQQLLEREGLRFERYDTGKVLNLLLHMQGARLAYLELPELLHLGGFSAWRPELIPAYRHRWPLRAWLRRLIRPGSAPGPGPVKMTEENRLRRDINCYFREYLDSLSRHQPAPPMPAGLDPAVAQKMRDLQEQIRRCHDEFAED